MHEEWTDRLSEYLDGELSADEQRALESHLRTCAPCAAVLNDLKRVVARAQAAGAAARPPQADLWAGIAERIDASRTWNGGAVPLDNVSAFRGRAPRRIAFTLPQLAAAAVVVAAVSGGLTWQLRPGLSGTPEGAPYEAVRADDAIASLQKLMTAARGRSPLHEALIARVKRQPIAVARLLAGRYPETPAISYIPALAWAQTLRLTDITNDGSLREKVWRETRPWIAGEKKLFGDRVQLTAIAGTLIFADLAAGSAGRASRARGPHEPPAVLGTASEQAAAQALADQGVLLAAAEKAPGVPEYGQGWTDDMFMATAVLARSGIRPGHERDLDLAARLLIEYAARLQQPGGLFHHATDGPAAWGRGNGFAALGLMETLTRLPASHPARAQVLDIYRRQMAAALLQQAPDGMWRQIIDADGAYREETATAMLMSAMARGVRLGWLDRSYLAAIRRAWRGLAAHVTDDGGVIDVCASTGAGPTRRYYFDRPAVTGPDDRGGAMALLAALEMHELGKM